MAVPAGRPTSEQRITAALWFAERGFGIFPVWSARDGSCRCPAGGSCQSPGKHPVTPNGFQDATTDEGRIRTFLAAASEPNYGMVCPEGVFALDVDGEDGPRRLRELEARLGPLPATLRTATANGLHIFLRWPEGHPRPLRQMFGFVTRWGSGRMSGYVLGPRSVHASGVEYRPADDSAFEIAELPLAWAEAATAATTVTVGGRTEPGSVTTGHRHDHLRDTARLYAGTVRDPDALFAAVWAENEKLPAPKTREEVERAIGDVLARFGPDPVEELDDGGLQRVPQGDLGIAPPGRIGEFPPPPDPEAFGGLVGECVDAIQYGTDASEAGLLACFTAVCGAMVPARAYSRGWQTSSPYVALVGDSAVGRKSTAMNRALDAARRIWQANAVNKLILDGLNSGEALVTEMARRHEQAGGWPTVGLIFEDEFASMLQSRSREGSTLDQKIRSAFDGNDLSNRRASGTVTIQPPYWLPALSAITPSELRDRIGAGSMQNGSANRWLYVPVAKRPVIAPDEEPIVGMEQAQRLVTAWDQGRERTLRVDAAVSRELSEYADFVIAESHGVARDLVKRYATLAFRVALVHAAVESSPSVTAAHLRRALALAEYCRRGISWVFGQTVGDEDADLLFRFLQAEGSLTNRQITQQIIRPAVRRHQAVDELLRLGYAQLVPVATGGRARMDLVLDPSARAYVPYVQRSYVRTPEDNAQNGTEGASPSTSHAGTEVAQNLHTSRTEAAQMGDESPADEPVVDRSTGEVKDATAEFAKPCSDYASHQDWFRGYPIGWVCLACHPVPESNAGLCATCGAGPFATPKDRSARDAEDRYARHWHVEHGSVRGGEA